MEFVVDVDANPGIFHKVLREIMTLSIAWRNLHGVLESIVVVFLNLGLFGPVQLREDFNILIGENGTRRRLFQLAYLAESGGILIGIMEA